MLALFGLLFVVYFAEAQQYQSCANGGVGPCVALSCPSPATQTCITTAPGQQICCENSQIINPTTTATCRDLVNPRTGISDCPNVAYLCNNAAYYALMTQQCPRTCNRCPSTATVAPTTATCQDLVNPRTGMSECASKAYLCNNSNYYALMTQQCPRTCNRCPGQNTGVVAPIPVVAPTAVVAPTVAVTQTGTNTFTSGCQDLVDPRTGVSNCAQVASYCRDARYLNLMRQQCPRTCGYC